MKPASGVVITVGLASVAIMLGQFAPVVDARSSGGDGGLAGGGTDCSTAPAAVIGANAYNTSGATASLAVAAGAGCGAHTMYKVNYFSFTPTESGNYTFTTCDSATWDTRIAVLPACGANQVPIICNDDACAYQSSATGALVAATTYRIALGGYGSADGGASSLGISFGGSGGGGGGGTNGPDVIVGAIPDIASYGSVVVSGQTIMAYAIGTTSCNIGDALLDWFAAPDNRHPFIPMNFYRIKSGRIEQIGQGWGKHGFYALQQSLCGTCTPSSSGSWLGVGCSDPYSAGLNGGQSGLGTRSEVNAATGVFPGSPNAGMPSAAATIGRRIQVNATDLNPSLNAGAVYLAEAQYLHPGDALAANDDNNASWRQMSVGSLSGGAYSITFTGATTQQQTAINAWPVFNPAVTLVEVDVPDDGRFTVGYVVTQTSPTNWHYEYAIQNMNSDRSGNSFSVPVPTGTTITNAGFKDIDYHSGDPFSPTNWTISTTSNAVSWTGGNYATSANGNALRFGTLYNFWFDSNQAPVATNASLGLFKPGTIGSMAVAVSGPGGAPAVPGDLDGDGLVSAADLAILLGQWGATGAADLDNSGSVDAVDLATILGLWS